MSSDNPILRAITMLQDYKGDLASRSFADNDEGDHQQRINENKRASVDAAIRALRDRSNYDAILYALRQQGLSIDGDNAYKRDLLDAVVGAMMLGRLNTNPPPADHWAQRFWDIGREYGALPEVAPAVNQQLTTGASLAMPDGLHSDTQDLVTRFATALAVKLHAAELKHGYSNGWKDPSWMDECRKKLLEHLAKGDPCDVAAYCAFLWHHCQSTAQCLWMGSSSPVSAGGVDEHVPDKVFQDEFQVWWEEEGQFCRAGGGNYERAFAFQAWRHLYPMLMQARAALTTTAPNHSEQVRHMVPDGFALVSLERVAYWKSFLSEHYMGPGIMSEFDELLSAAPAPGKGGDA